MAQFVPFWLREECYTPCVCATAVGDIMLSRGVGRSIQEHGLMYLFTDVRDALQADVVFGNLECPISENGAPAPWSHSHFRASPETAEGLARMGFTVLNLANNHILDYGSVAARETCFWLKKAGVQHIGGGVKPEDARRPAQFTSAGLGIAVLGYTTMVRGTRQTDRFSIAPLSLSDAEHDISMVRAAGHRCVVSVHTGHEGIEYPPPEQRKQFRMLADMGADVVLGHHPHVVQGMEVYKGSLLAYSLGNFVFDQQDARRQQGMILRVELDSNGLARVEYLPVSIGVNGKVSIASGQLRRDACSSIERLSETIAEGESDDLFWQSAGESFVETQAASISRTWSSGGVQAILRTLRRIRPKHFRLLLVWCLRRLRPGGGSR